jgi:hypothetical protein
MPGCATGTGLVEMVRPARARQRQARAGPGPPHGGPPTSCCSRRASTRQACARSGTPSTGTPESGSSVHQRLTDRARSTWRKGKVRLLGHLPAYAAHGLGEPLRNGRRDPPSSVDRSSVQYAPSRPHVGNLHDAGHEFRRSQRLAPRPDLMSASRPKPNTRPGAALATRPCRRPLRRHQFATPSLSGPTTSRHEPVGAERLPATLGQHSTTPIHQLFCRRAGSAVANRKLPHDLGLGRRLGAGAVQVRKGRHDQEGRGPL